MNRRVPLVMSAMLALPTAAVAFGFCRLFTGWSYLPPLLATVAGTHLAAVLTRRARPLIGDTLHVGLGILAAVWLTVLHSTIYGLPSARTVDVLRHDMSIAWHSFAVESTPVAPRTGYVFVAVIALWLAGWAADRLSFRYQTPAEALLPTATIFVFVTLLSAPRLRLVSTLVYGAAAALFVLTYRAWRRPEARRAILVAGVLTSATALVVSTVVVTQVPGAQGAGALAVRDLGRKRTDRTVVSPLVDIRRRLVDQSDAELMRVTADRPSYWRLMALDQFDGTVWSSDQSFDKARSELRSALPASLPTTTLRQTFRIGSLDQPWVPAAYEASSVTEGGSHLLWDPQSATLIVDRSRGSAAGLIYTVESAIPDTDGDALRALRGPIPAEVEKTDTELPRTFPDEVSRIALAVTQGASTDYDKAIKLQNWFRDTFRYSLDVPAGQSSQAIVDFLRTRVGYCEQFSGTFAAMARSLGIPARVVVGFTSGTPSKDDPNTYVVFGRNAHAWPEVYLPGAGWTSFEPTPGRGDPQATRHTGVAPEQAGPDQVPEPAPTVPPTTLLSQPAPTIAGGPGAAIPTTLAPSPAQPAPALTKRSSASSDWVVWLLLGVSILLTLGALAGAGALRRRRRHSRARTDATRVLAYWDDLMEHASAVSIWASPIETHREIAERLGAAAPPLPTGALTELADLATAAAWAPQAASPAAVTRARMLSRRLCADLREHCPRRARVRLFLAALSPARPPRSLGIQSSRWSRLRMRSWPLAK